MNLSSSLSNEGRRLLTEIAQNFGDHRIKGPVTELGRKEQRRQQLLGHMHMTRRANGLHPITFRQTVNYGDLNVNRRRTRRASYMIPFFSIHRYPSLMHLPMVDKRESRPVGSSSCARTREYHNAASDLCSLSSTEVIDVVVFGSRWQWVVDVAGVVVAYREIKEYLRQQRAKMGLSDCSNSGTKYLLDSS